MGVYDLPQVYIEKTMMKSLKKENLFTNQKEINRAIRAAVNQFRKFLKYKRKKK